jgi:hypothetical protein
MICKTYYENMGLSPAEIENDITTAINIMLELIFDRKISALPEEAFVKLGNMPTTLYDNGKALCMPIFRIREMIEASGLEISFLSDALTAMGYKNPGSTFICYNNTSYECWEFIKTWEALLW